MEGMDRLIADPGGADPILQFHGPSRDGYVSEGYHSTLTAAGGRAFP